MSSPVDVCEVYTSFCMEDGCKANTAVLKYIEDCGRKFPLEKLILSKNYLGPRGLRPIVKLVAYCQTMTHLCLDGNGADNEIVRLLCEVLMTHKGMRTLSLRDNPITSNAGKLLVALVEKNPKIIHIDLTDTDVFEILIWKIDAATRANRQKLENESLYLVPIESEEKKLDTVVNKVEPKEGNASCQRPSSKKRLYLRDVERMTGDALTALGKAPNEVIPPLRGLDKGPDGNVRLTDSKSSPGIIRGKMKPPAPPATGRSATCLREAQRLELQRRYRERAMALREVHNSEANKVADQARKELMLIEQNTKNHAVSQSSRSDMILTPLEERTAVAEETAANVELSSAGFAPAETNTAGKEENQQQEAELQKGMSVSHRGVLGSFSLPDASSRFAHLSDHQELQSQKCEVAAAAAAPVKTNNMGPLNPTLMSSDHSVKGSVPTGFSFASRDSEDEMSVHVLMETQEWMVLSTSEKLTYLFESGCKAYVNQKFDTSYMAWKEAMAIAVGAKDREWMAVISNNLQRLSYEMLVREGSRLLNEYHLEDADIAFQCALDIARKAHNAKWESEMTNARKEVQVAIFHRCHEAALRMFDQAQMVVPREVTEDDYFIVPGTDVLVQHTAAYVNEWSCMLLVKEAVELWAAALRVAERIGGNVAHTLQMAVTESLTTVSGFLVQHFFDAEDPQALTWMNTSRYKYYECVMLTTLWTNMMSCSDFQENHKIFAALGAARIGNFYLATNQLSKAELQFAALDELAVQLNDSLLRATGQTFRALLNWQRARYPAAESHFRLALVEWGALRELIQRENLESQGFLTNPAADSQKGGSSSVSAEKVSNIATNRFHADSSRDTAFSGRTQPSKLLAFLPRGYVSMMESVCYKYLVSCIASVYRYAEALEMLERSLVCRYRDMLFDKLKINFSALPTLAHLTATASLLQSPLIYYLVVRRYDWCVESSHYKTEEHLLTWVVPQAGEMRFIEAPIEKDFRVMSVNELVQAVRQTLLLDPLDSTPVQAPVTSKEGTSSNEDEKTSATDGLIMELPQKTWMEPLKTLYSIFFGPIEAYLRALDPRFLGNNGVVTIIPADRLWLVPFNALMSRSGRYVVEDFAVQLAFCATQCRFAALNAKRVQQRDLFHDVVFAQNETENTKQLNPLLLYPLDFHRSETEGAAVMEALAHNKRDVRKLNNSPMTTEITSSELLVHGIEKFRERLPHSRTVHIAAATTYRSQTSDMGDSAICVVGSKGDLELLSSSEISRMELFAEHVIITNTNISTTRVCTVDDDVLCLIRGFLASGVPCVIAGQWCTPDMTPSLLFTGFYRYQAMVNKSIRRVPTLQNNSGQPVSQAVLMAADTEKEWAETDIGGDLNNHKALFLAYAVRHLLQDDSFRYSPRVWAGYYCIGYGLVERRSK
uniref:CHAT domain-containing protein n=1 Tax=Trypanosoma congolense (strain IL3000) TaxID=1068625 RepID=G0UVJ5_TRYCI|nr:conserved hypothetical protein [Trypanosoma congolense IL3000]